MREDGENGVPVTGEIETPVEHGILESLCDVSIHANGLLAHYRRFFGPLRYIVGNETVEDPMGTVGTSSPS